MKLFHYLSMCCFLACNCAFANCDLSTFRWDCELPVKIKPTSNTALLVCGQTNIYVNRAFLAQLARYQRANVSMNLNVNNEYIDGPCNLYEF